MLHLIFNRTKILVFLSLALLVSCNKDKEVASALNDGDTFFAEKKYEEAIFAYSQALDESNYSTSELNGDIYYKRSKSFYLILNYPQAEQDILKAIEENDEIGEYYNHYGDIHHTLTNWDLAIDNYNEAEDLGCNQPELYLKRGLSYIKLDKINKALKDLTKYYQSSPDSIGIAEICGNIYFNNGDYKEAYDYFKSYCNYSYANNKVLEKFSLCASKVEKYQEVLSATDTLIKRSIISSAIFELKGEALLKSNQPHQAIEALDSSINIDNNNDVALELRSEAYNKVGDVESEMQDIYRYKTLRFNHAGVFWNYCALPLCYILIMIVIHYLFHPYRERFAYSTPITYLTCIAWFFGAHYKYLRSPKRWYLALIIALFFGAFGFEIYIYYNNPSQLLNVITDNTVALILFGVIVLWFIYDLITLDYQVYCAQTNSRICKKNLESRLNVVENSNTQIIKALEQFILPTPEKINEICRECSDDAPEKLKHYFVDGLNALFGSEISHRKVRKERNVAKKLAEYAKSYDKSTSLAMNSVRKTILRTVEQNICITEDCMILTKCALHTLDTIKVVEQSSLYKKSNKTSLIVTTQQTSGISLSPEQQADNLINEQLVTKVLGSANNVIELLKYIPNPYLAAVAVGYVTLKAASVLADAYCADEFKKAVSAQKLEIGPLIKILNNLEDIKQTLLKISRVNVDLINQNRLIAMFYGNNVQDVLYLQPSISNYYKYRIKKEYYLTDKNRGDISTLIQINSQVNEVIKIVNEKILKK